MKHIATLAILLPITIVLTNLLALTYSELVYKTFFKSSEDFSFALGVVNYLKLGTPLDSNYFSDQAQRHMADVKNLYNMAKIANSITLLFLFAQILFLIKYKKFVQLKKGIIAGAIILTLLILVIFSVSLMNFDYSFVIFHKLLFRNNDWLFRADDNLVKLFNLDFFVLFFRKLVTNILLTMFVVLLLVKWIPKK